jgi:hypothetical protein
MIAVDDSLLVRGREALGDLCSDIDRRFEVDRPRPRCLAQGPAIDELHDDTQLMLRGRSGGGGVHPLFNGIDGTDIGMIDRRGGPGFLEKAGPVGVGCGKRRGEELECDGTVEPGVPGFVHEAHSAPAQLFQNRVV